MRVGRETAEMSSMHMRHFIEWRADGAEAVLSTRQCVSCSVPALHTAVSLSMHAGFCSDPTTSPLTPLLPDGSPEQLSRLQQSYSPFLKEGLTAYSPCMHACRMDV